MNAEKKVYNSLIQLDNGSNYEVVESITVIELLLTENIVDDNTFITFHFPDGLECKIKKNKISAFYEYDD
ncbi:MAG TPA: hypothetical protein VN131_06730 [Mobilitalea sp.]|nr:hypothetical protein [Mobilitalea sp.]